VIAGAGGATAAALAYAVDQGFEDINIIARDPGRVFDKLGSRFAAKFRIVPCERAHLAMKGADVLINATPMGSSHGAPMRRDILEGIASATPGAAVLDMNYAPVETELLRAAARAGLVPVSGLDMLIGQARRAFELLFGCAPPGNMVMATDEAGFTIPAQADLGYSVADPLGSGT
jgi:shikimate dehydrogenase